MSRYTTRSTYFGPIVAVRSEDQITEETKARIAAARARAAARAAKRKTREAARNAI